MEEKSKRKIAVVVIGPTNSGKSTLIGQLLFQLGEIVNLSSFEKRAVEIGKPNSYFALVKARCPYEKLRASTADVNFSKVETKTTIFNLIDVPGKPSYLEYAN